MPEVATTAEPEWIPWSIRAGRPAEVDPREQHLAGLRQLTFEGSQAAPRWSPDGKKLVFESSPPGGGCSQVVVMDLGSGEVKQVSRGGARATGGVFCPAGDRLLYAAAPAAGGACPPGAPARGGRALGELDLFSAAPDGSDARPLLGLEGYDADVAVAPDGSRLVLTSTRDGDPELYAADLDGQHLRRLTHAPGFDGEASFSPDSARLVWSAARPAPRAQPVIDASGNAEIWIAGAEGQGARAVTSNGHRNVAPAFLPGSRRVIFASDAGSPGRLALHVIDPDGPLTAAGGPVPERVTFAEGSDSSPSISPDGRALVFTSSRRAGAQGSPGGETHVFVTRWVP